jgi:ParB family transcriptional regulator, chromosome partitioning protein
MESAMQLTTVPLSALLAPKSNPRTTYDNVQIAGLAQSIRADGVLQNLLVRPEGEKFRVVAGKRRYLALHLLKKEKVIDGTYPVPVDIREGLEDADLLRIATVENIQREQLPPMDEAEAFARMLKDGALIEDVAAKAGVSAQTVKRRVALASLSNEAKGAVRDGTITLAVAEALTLGTAEQQRAMLADFEEDYLPDADEIRAMLVGEKPSVATAIFPADQYTGTLTADLFSDEETTFFDDVDQFMALQKEAVEALADRHRQTAAWAEILYTFSPPWWQYDGAAEGEPAGVVIHLHPSGAVEVREGLTKHEVQEAVVEATRETPVAPKAKPERPAFNAPLMRYVAHQKSAAVQAALLQNPRKAKEVAAWLLLLGLRVDFGLRLSLHACLMGPPEGWQAQRSYRAIDAEAAALSGRLGLKARDDRPGSPVGIEQLLAGRAAPGLLQAVGQLTDAELERLVILLPVLCFGQENDERFDTGDSLFNGVAAGLGIKMRDWWTPDTAFFSGLVRDQVDAVAAESGAREEIQGTAEMSKKALVAALADYFGACSSPETGEGNAKARTWLPGMFRFPAVATLASEPSNS